MANQTKLNTSKTNWKYIIIVVILAVIVGVVALWCSTRQELSYQPPEIRKPEKIEITEELANKVIDKIVLDQKKYDRETVKFFINDLNNDKTSEIIVCLASSPGWEAEEAYVTVVTPTDKNGNYKNIGDFIFSFNKEEKVYFRDTPFLDTPCVDDTKNLVDIDGDGKKEMILNLGLLGVSGYAYTIFKIDWDLHKIDRIKARNKEGSIEDYYFVNAAALMHRAGFYLEGLDNDKTMEIVEIYDTRVESASEANLVEEGNNYWKREYVVYKWNGSIFNYNEKLSNRFVKSTGTTCEEWLRECAKEGEDRCTACGCRACCPGLVSRDVTHPYRTENNEVVCLENMTAYVCVKCGDGTCGEGEDWCICPEDCPKPNPNDLEFRRF